MLYKNELNHLIFSELDLFENVDNQTLEYLFDCFEKGLVECVCNLYRLEDKYLIVIKIDGKVNYKIISISDKLINKLNSFNNESYKPFFLSILKRVGNGEADREDFIEIIEVNDDYISLILNQGGMVLFCSKDDKNYENLLLKYNLKIIQDVI